MFRVIRKARAPLSGIGPNVPSVRTVVRRSLKPVPVRRSRRTRKTIIGRRSTY